MRSYTKGKKLNRKTEQKNPQQMSHQILSQQKTRQEKQNSKKKSPQSTKYTIAELSSKLRGDKAFNEEYRVPPGELEAWFRRAVAVLGINFDRVGTTTLTEVRTDGTL
jgi:hypothetical protein